MKHTEQQEKKRQLATVFCLLLLLLAGIGIMAYSVIAQDRVFLRDMEEYTELAAQVEIKEASLTPAPTPGAHPNVTAAPLVRGTEKPISPLYEALPAEEYWSARVKAENGTESTAEESEAASSAGSIIVILPGSANNPESQGSTAPEKEQETGKDGAGGQLEKPQNPVKPSEPYETPLPLASTAQPTIQPEPTVTPAPTPRVGKTGVDLDACKAQNEDFVAWLKIPGTKINYPVVWTDNVDYYLTHTFSGKESKVGTLFSLGKTDYKSPGKNIAIYGHHITTSGENMFQPLMSYKKQSFWENHKTIYLDTLYHLGEYTVFAVINMRSGEWDPAAATFTNSLGFMLFIQRAKSEALYDTGIKVNADDHIITLITCDRDYHNPDGRLIVMAVEQ